MAAGQPYPTLEALLKLEASLKEHLCGHEASPRGGDELRRVRACSPRSSRSRLGERWMRLRKFVRAWCPQLRKFAIVGGTLGGLVLLALVALWWRLSSGPIELDIATPWLTAAIKENFGPGHEVEIGGTQIERDANKRRTSLRIRDIVVRDADGTIVASAPKAEVGISGAGLLAGRIRAERRFAGRRRCARRIGRVRPDAGTFCSLTVGGKCPAAVDRATPSTDGEYNDRDLVWSTLRRRRHAPADPVYHDAPRAGGSG